MTEFISRLIWADTPVYTQLCQSPNVSFQLIHRRKMWFFLQSKLKPKWKKLFSFIGYPAPNEEMISSFSSSALSLAEPRMPSQFMLLWLVTPGTSQRVMIIRFSEWVNKTTLNLMIPSIHEQLLWKYVWAFCLHVCVSLAPEEMVGSAEPLLHLIDLLMASFSKFSHVSCLRIQSIADSCGHSLGCKSVQK